MVTDDLNGHVEDWKWAEVFSGCLPQYGSTAAMGTGEALVASALHFEPMVNLERERERLKCFLFEIDSVD